MGMGTAQGWSDGSPRSRSEIHICIYHQFPYYRILETHFKMPEKFKLGFAENFALSGAAAVISKTAAAPIERVKLLVQNQDEMIKQGKLSEPYKGVIDCTKRTFATEGLGPFWRGNLANCIRYFPTQALNFAFKDKIKAIFKQSNSDPYAVNFAKNIASGGAAGALSLCFVYSLDFARTKLANDGIQGLYRGFVISCVGIIVYRGCYFGFYDSLKPILLGDDANVFLSFCLGYGVTVTSGLISY